MTKLFNKQAYKQRRRKLRQTMPKGEMLVWGRLRNRHKEYKFRRQYGVGPYVVDLYCPKLKLVIEIDGIIHYDKLVALKDLERQAYLESQGMSVIRFPSNKVFDDLDDVIDTIYMTCLELDNKF